MTENDYFCQHYLWRHTFNAKSKFLMTMSCSPQNKAMKIYANKCWRPKLIVTTLLVTKMDFSNDIRPSQKDLVKKKGDFL